MTKTDSTPKFGQPVLAIVEGVYDVEFLRRISAILHANDPEIPSLADMERRGQLIFVPFGGVGLEAWTWRFQPLGLPEFYLVDAELAPETDRRRRILDRVNRRPLSVGLLTSKRATENYLNAEAVHATRGIRIEFGDQDNVPDVLAQGLYHRQDRRVAWENIELHKRRRRRAKAKRSLNTQIASCMTAELLAERDPEDEVVGWIRTIERLANGSVLDPVITGSHPTGTAPIHGSAAFILD